MRARRLPSLVSVGVAAAALTTACTSTPHQDAVSSVARSFVSALERGDGAAACRLLTSDAEQSAAGATDVSCDKAIMSIKEHGTSVNRVEVWGDAAQVRVAGDVVFLRRIEGAWRVSAAGCRPRPPGPYDCMVGS